MNSITLHCERMGSGKQKVERSQYIQNIAPSLLCKQDDK